MSSGTYQMPKILFSNPACRHIVTLGGENVHLERSAEGFKVAYGRRSKPKIEDYASLEVFLRRHPYWNRARWQDISAFPELPFNTCYQPFSSTIEGVAIPGGSYVVYGPAEVEDVSSSPDKQIRPQANWLVIEHPGQTWSVVSATLVGKKSGKLAGYLYRRFYKVIHFWRLYGPSIGKQQRETVYEPGYLVVYGQPLANWREAPQLTIQAQPFTDEDT